MGANGHHDITWMTLCSGLSADKGGKVSDLENVQKGDTVVYWPASQFEPPEFVPVEHATKTMIVAKGQHWQRKTGWSVAHTARVWWPTFLRIEAVTEDSRRKAEIAIAAYVERQRRRDAERTIRYARLELVAVETLESVATLLREAGAEA